MTPPGEGATRAAYPECEKLAAAAAERNAILDFLSDGRWTLCRLGDSGKTRMGESVLEYAPCDADAAVLEWLNIDPRVLERERRAMLKALES